MAGKLKPLFSGNFSYNLDQIRGFLELESRPTFERMMDRLFDDIVPLLCTFPKSGRNFLSMVVESQEALVSLRRLKKLLKKGDELREFVFDDYILLYIVRKEFLIFLSIKHHRQLSFDFRRFWSS